MKIANRSARSFVQQQLPFEGSNLFATWFCVNPSSGDPMDFGYVVYSYGKHWPLFIHINGVWFENEERHSVTTSKHRSQTHPHCDTTLLSLSAMQRLLRGGFRELVRVRILHGRG